MANVFYSTVIRAAVQEVWPLFRDFGKLATWHPLIADCQIESNHPPDQVGCVRSFHLADGALFREKLLALNDLETCLSYAIESSPLPMENYVATMKLTRITDGDFTFVSWSSSFDCPPANQDELMELVQDEVYAAGLKSVKQSLEQ